MQHTYYAAEIYALHVPKNTNYFKQWEFM